MFDTPPPAIEILSILPIAIVAITGILALIVEILQPRRTNNLLVAVCLGGLALAGLSVITALGQPGLDTAADMIHRDVLSNALQLVIIIGTALVVFLSEPYLREKRIPFGEFYPLVLWSSVGAMIMCTTVNLLMIFLGLEILSVALYVMAGMSRREEKSEESALKYFLLGAFASGFLLYGIAMIYGATGSLNIASIPLTWVQNVGASRMLLIFGLALLLVGFSFKASFVPFHQWTPDVYQGSPTNVTAFMATASKIGAFAALYRVLDAAGIYSHLWIPAVSLVAAATMLFGNIGALVQKDVKRTLGYSSVGHAGYILVAIIAHAKTPSVGYETIAYYLLSYTFMTIGAFAVVTLAAKNGAEGTSFHDLRGLWKRSPVATACLVFFISSMIGIPPLSGFWGKLFILKDALRADLVPLALVLAVSSVISVWYYLGILRTAFSENPDEDIQTSTESPTLKVTVVICAAAVLLLGLVYSPIMTALGLSNGTQTVAMKELSK